MRDLGPPTLVARLVVAGLALMALGVAAFWMWTTTSGVVVAGVPPWVAGLATVALLVCLAVAVDRVRNPRP